MPELPSSKAKPPPSASAHPWTPKPRSTMEIPLRITVSIGLCEADPEHADLESAMALASACLHRAHLAGGNQVATPASPPPKGFLEGAV